MSSPKYEPGDVVIVDFPGVQGVKRRPAVVVSSKLYHAHRPDIIVGLITGQVHSSNSPTDWRLQEWDTAGLRKPSAFRSFLFTPTQQEVIARIGRLSPADWAGVQESIERALGPF